MGRSLSSRQLVQLLGEEAIEVEVKLACRESESVSRGEATGQLLSRLQCVCCALGFPRLLTFISHQF